MLLLPADKRDEEERCTGDRWTDGSATEKPEDVRTEARPRNRKTDTRSITSVTSWGGQVQELCVWVVLVCFGGWGDMKHAESRVLANQTLRGSLLG